MIIEYTAGLVALVPDWNIAIHNYHTQNHTAELRADSRDPKTCGEKVGMALTKMGYASPVTIQIGNKVPSGVACFLTDYSEAKKTLEHFILGLQGNWQGEVKQQEE